MQAINAAILNKQALSLEAYLKHESQGSIMIESVECKEVLLPHHKYGLSYTSTGYGNKLPTRYMVKADNGLSMRWYRVYSICHSNTSTEYIVMRGTTIIVDLIAKG